MKFTSVVGYHLNPDACGVARWNQELAKRLGVPFVGLDGEWGDSPLLSLKWSELDESARSALLVRVAGIPFRVFWHDEGAAMVTLFAQKAWWAFRDGLWCPPAPLPHVSRAATRIFAFGMGHKVQPAFFRKVDALIAATGMTYDLRVSVALHEGTNLRDVSMKFAGLESVVGKNGELKVLGCLSDMALAEELAAADAVCAFFPEGVRSNNTSVWTAMRAGAAVVTNLDRRSPPDLRHGINVFDLAQLQMWPGYHQLRAVGAAGQSTVRDLYADWDLFVEVLCERSPSASGSSVTAIPASS